jgi:hypothetical protein
VQQAIGLEPDDPSSASMRLLVVLLVTGGLRAATADDRPTPSRAGVSPRVAQPDTVREYRGTYETGFEVSWFHPCGAERGDDRWWVTLGDDALRQRDSLAKLLPNQPRAVFVRWRGTVSPKMPAGTGHMGRGSRYMLVTEILELRPAEEAGCAKV